MSTSIYIGRRSLINGEHTEPSHISSIPCKIEHDGEAKISEYFHTSTREQDQGMTSSLHGRGLNGKTIDLPEGYTGIILREDKKPFLEDEDRHFKVTHRFQQFTYWNWDKVPSVNDTLSKAMAWPAIASAIHSSVDETSSQNGDNSQNSVTGKR
ncbi:ribonuclease H2 subunit C-like [Glandiceps talaboti]